MITTTIKTNILVLCVSLFFVVSCKNEDKKPTIKIEKDLVGMVGYGSLISKRSMERTLKRKYNDSIYLVHLEGYQRKWNYINSNDNPLLPAKYLESKGFYIKENDTLPFEKSIYLNITKQNESAINCVLYFITPEELSQFDRREIGYERIDITKKIKEYNFSGGTVYVYKALPDYTYNPDEEKSTAVIKKSYIDLVRAACDSIGRYYRQEYEATTKPFDTSLIAPVIWKKAE